MHPVCVQSACQRPLGESTKSCFNLCDLHHSLNRVSSPTVWDLDPSSLSGMGNHHVQIHATLLYARSGSQVILIRCCASRSLQAHEEDTWALLGTYTTTPQTWPSICSLALDSYVWDQLAVTDLYAPATSVTVSARQTATCALGGPVLKNRHR